VRASHQIDLHPEIKGGSVTSPLAAGGSELKAQAQACGPHACQAWPGFGLPNFGQLTEAFRQGPAGFSKTPRNSRTSSRPWSCEGHQLRWRARCLGLSNSTPAGAPWRRAWWREGALSPKRPRSRHSSRLRPLHATNGRSGWRELTGGLSLPGAWGMSSLAGVSSRSRLLGFPLLPTAPPGDDSRRRFDSELGPLARRRRLAAGGAGIRQRSMQGTAD